MLLGKNPSSPSILFITGYRPGHRTGSAGLTTTWAQQEAILMQQKRNVTPYESFLLDLKNWIQAYSTPNMEIFLSLDANEHWSEDASITQFAQQLQLSCINDEFQLQHTHPNLANPERGTTIDFYLCSYNLLQCITYAGSAPYNLEVLGDHHGFIVDIDITLFLETDTGIDESKQRKLTLSNVAVV